MFKNLLSPLTLYVNLSGTHSNTFSQRRNYRI